MILLFGKGRVGNQLFQYVAMRGIRKRGRLALVGFDALRAQFKEIDGCIGSNGRGKLIRLIGRVCKQSVAYAAKLGLIGKIEEQRHNGRMDIRITESWLKWKLYYAEGYFQCDEVLRDEHIRTLAFREESENRANSFLSQLADRSRKRVFVHIRRGDYVRWPAVESPAVLPLRWYMKAMDIFRSNYESPIFVICTDDLPYAEDMFGEIGDVVISHANAEVDLAIMAGCEGGILSASSFSWWGARLARERYAQGLFMAPLYWIGSRSGRWIPPHVKTAWLEYLAV